MGLGFAIFIIVAALVVAALYTTTVYDYKSQIKELSAIVDDDFVIYVGKNKKGAEDLVEYIIKTAKEDNDLEIENISYESWGKHIQLTHGVSIAVVYYDENAEEMAVIKGTATFIDDTLSPQCIALIAAKNHHTCAIGTFSQARSDNNEV